MATPVVFYSWQSDLPRLTTRDVIHSAAAIAIERLAGCVVIEDAPRLDHDTLGESGAPPIAETIFRKIRDSAVVLADVTFVGNTEPRDGQKKKKLPNPNVLIELGYAAATIGWGRILLVMNKHYGSPESLPFDLKDKRFPITFTLSSDSSKPPPTEELADDLVTAIRQHLTNEYTRVEGTLARLSPYAPKMLYDYGGGPGFHPTKLENKIVSLEDLAILQFIELGIVLASPAPNEAGFSYSWTYLGRQCISRLGVCPSLPDPPAIPEFPDMMSLNASWYEKFSTQIQDGRPTSESPAETK